LFRYIIPGIQKASGTRLSAFHRANSLAVVGSNREDMEGNLGEFIQHMTEKGVHGRMFPVIGVDMSGPSYYIYLDEGRHWRTDSFLIALKVMEVLIRHAH